MTQPTRLPGRDVVALAATSLALWVLAVLAWVVPSASAVFGYARLGGVTSLVLALIARHRAREPGVDESTRRLVRVAVSLTIVTTVVISGWLTFAVWTALNGEWLTP